MDLETLKNHEEWNESYYFNFHDQSNDLTVFMRIGNKVNKNEKSMFFYLMSSEIMAGIKLETPCDDRPWSIAGLEYQETGPWKWRLQYDGPLFNPQDKSEFKVKMDIIWESLNPLMDYVKCVDEKETHLSSKVASEHYEQFGKAEGTIIVDGKTWEIEALGERDLSRGIRQWGSPRMWMWINSQFSSEEAFNITKLSVAEGDIDAGYFYQDGVNNTLINADIDLKMNKGVPSKFSMLLKDKKGGEYPVEGKVIRMSLIPVEGNMILMETLSHYTWDNKEGYGVAEFLVPDSKKIK